MLYNVINFPVLKSCQKIHPIHRLCEMFRNEFIFYGWVLLAQSPSWSTTQCRLSATAYSVYLQLPSVYGVSLLYLQPEDVPCCGDRTHLMWWIQLAQDKDWWQALVNAMMNLWVLVPWS
jgi:hypothetical protein